MHDRSQKILESAIQGFIDTGEPISSSWLFDNYDFGIKPAMIRLELEDLSEKGYLEQPYHSAGRVPTNKGYEFFAELAIENAELGVHGLIFEHLKKLFSRRDWKDFIAQVSEELGLFGVVGDTKEGAAYGEGLENLVGELETDSREEIKSVIKDCLELQHNVFDAAERLSDEVLRVFVGRRNPFLRNENLSLVASEYKLEDGEVILLTIGPKRMDYRKTIKIFKNLHG